MEENKVPLYDEDGHLLEESFMPDRDMGDMGKEEEEQ